MLKAYRVIQKVQISVVFMLLPGAQVSVCGLVQHTAEIMFGQCLLWHLLQLLLPLQGQTVVLQLDALGSSTQTLG